MSDAAHANVTETGSMLSSLIMLLDSGSLPSSPPHACPYLPEQLASEQAFATDRLDGETYHDLMDLGFRRSGHVYYRPRCEHCKACVPLRVPVDAFKPSRSQRRVKRRNTDVIVRVGTPDLTREKHQLYQRYILSQHIGTPQGTGYDDLEDFLYSSPVTTLEATYYAPPDRLIGVSILDVSSRSVSTVYHFFDPAEGRRSPGVFSVLAEIDLCRAWGLPHYYMGYWIAGAVTMDYKANYLPHELLIGGQWVRRESRGQAMESLKPAAAASVHT